ncbi:hypothetical protein Bca4012_103526 [Brassica carinata]
MSIPKPSGLQQKHHSRWAGLLADSVPADFRGYVFRPRFKTYLGLGRIVRIASGFHQTPARKVSRNMQLNSLLSPTRRRCLFGSSAAMHVCLGVTNRRPHPLEDMGRKLVSVCYARGWPKSELRAPGASRHAVVNSSLVISSVVRSEALDDPKSSTRPQVRRDHPLSLSISISGGKETNKDSLSNGERTGRAQLENRASSANWCSLRSVLSDGPGPSSLERGAREGESPSCRTLSHHAGAVYESGCLGMQPQSGGKFRPRLNMGETDSEQVPRVKMKRTLKRESKSA